jgi:hypothetical protein
MVADGDPDGISDGVGVASASGDDALGDGADVATVRGG